MVGGGGGGFPTGMEAHLNLRPLYVAVGEVVVLFIVLESSLFLGYSHFCHLCMYF